MKLTKTIVGLVIKNAPKGATHLKLVDGKKWHVEAFKGAPAAFDDVAGDLFYGAMAGKGPAAKFVPLAGGPVDVARFASVPSVLSVAPVVKPVQSEVPGTEPEVVAKVKKVSRKVAAPVKEKKAKEPKERKPSKCAFIDDMLEAGKHTVSEILAATLKAFPDADAKATLATVRCRPSHMRKAGRKPVWLPEKEAK